MPETKKPDAPKHPVVDEKPSAPAVQPAAPVPERRQEEVRELDLLDVSVPPRAPGAAGAPAPTASMNDVLKYWNLIMELLHAIQAGVANVKFRITAPGGKKKNVQIIVTDA